MLRRKMDPKAGRFSDRERVVRVMMVALMMSSGKYTIGIRIRPDSE